MTESIDYNTDLEQLLKLHAEECESLSILHRNAYEKYNGRSNYINIPVIILSSAIGFATGIDIGYDKMNIILGISSIFVGIIKSIDTYFQLGKRAESHRLCSLQFQQINKKIQIELALVRSQRVDAKDMMNIIKTDIKNLFDIAPLIDQDVIRSFQKKYGHQVVGTPGKYTFDAHTPNLCNGLSIVTVNSARNKQDYEERSSRKSSRDGSPSRDNDGGNNPNGGGNNGNNNGNNGHNPNGGGNNGGGNNGNHGGGNNNNNGITVVIDDAAIALEQQQLQSNTIYTLPHDQLHQQLQQLQQLQQPASIDVNSYRATADLVSLHSSRAPSVRNTAPNSARNTAPTSVHPPTNSVHNTVPNSVHNTAPNSVHNTAPNSVHNTAPNSVHGGSTPPNTDEHIVVEIPEITEEQLQQQLQQLQQLQIQQMMLDLNMEGENIEMM